MKKKLIKHLISGILLVLAFVVFIRLLIWLALNLFSIGDSIFALFPKEWFPDYHFMIKIIIIVVVIGLIYCLGYLWDHSYTEKGVNIFFDSITKEVPILNFLFKTVKQIKNNLNREKTFEKVVLVRFPSHNMYSIGFITNEDMSVFNRILKEDTVFVFIPTTPNPTNGFLSIMRKPKKENYLSKVFAKQDIIETDIPVEKAISSLISMGTITIDENQINSYLN